MPTIAKSVQDRVLSVNGSQSNGRPIFVGGQEFTWQIEAPAALGRIEISNDKVTWAQAVTAQGDGMGQVVTRPLWVRSCTLSDAGGPRSFYFWYAISQEND